MSGWVGGNEFKVDVHVFWGQDVMQRMGWRGDVARYKYIDCRLDAAQYQVKSQFK